MPLVGSGQETTDGPLVGRLGSYGTAERPRQIATLCTATLPSGLVGLRGQRVSTCEEGETMALSDFPQLSFDRWSSFAECKAK